MRNTAELSSPRPFLCRFVGPTKASRPFLCRFVGPTKASRPFLCRFVGPTKASRPFLCRFVGPTKASRPFLCRFVGPTKASRLFLWRFVGPTKASRPFLWHLVGPTKVSRPFLSWYFRRGWPPCRPARPSGRSSASIPIGRSGQTEPHFPPNPCKTVRRGAPHTIKSVKKYLFACEITGYSVSLHRSCKHYKITS